MAETLSPENQRELKVVCDKIAELTDENYHSESLMALTGFLENIAPDYRCRIGEISSEIKGLMVEHRQLGYLSGSLYEKRRAFYEELMGLAQRHLSPVDYQKVYSVF